MKLNDLCKTCVNINVNTTVYIHSDITIEGCRVCKVKDILDEHGNDTIEWFSIRYDETLDVWFM